jgi:hypothetical protein
LHLWAARDAAHFFSAYTMEINALLACFKAVRPNGSGWSALCPAHEDQHNSLTIAVGDKGILVCCHAGCPAEAVVAAVGLNLRDLFPNDRNNLSCIPSRNRADVQTGAAHERPSWSGAGKLTTRLHSMGGCQLLHSRNRSRSGSRNSPGQRG